jgi:hypothetical protein
LKGVVDVVLVAPAVVIIITVIASRKWPVIKRKRFGTKYLCPEGPKHGIMYILWAGCSRVLFKPVVVLTTVYVPDCNEPPLMAFQEGFGE